MDIKDFLSEEDAKEMAEILNMAGMDDWEYDSVSNNYKLLIKIINNSNNPDPIYRKEGDSGFDLSANLPEGAVITVQPLKRAVIPTGLHFQIPKGYELQVRPRSGLALKNGITVLNTPGTVDSNYRGEIMIILFNTDEIPFEVKNGDRIAQGVIASVNQSHTTKIKKVNVLDPSERNSSGFGSTGV